MAANPHSLADLSMRAAGPRAEASATPEARLVLGASALIGAVGLLQRAPRSAAAPAADWRDAQVDVVIALRRDQATIVHCLAGLHAQQRRPRRVVLVDDGRVERDGTAVLAREFAAANGMRLELFDCAQREGDCREALFDHLDADAVLVLGGDTVLDSPGYLDACLQALYAGACVGSVCGEALPLRDEDRRRWADSDAFRRWVGRDAYVDAAAPRSDAEALLRWLGDSYRECAGRVQQRFVHRGQLRAFGSLPHPLGAVLYRCSALDAVHDARGPVDLVSGDAALRLGFALADEGYRVVQQPGVTARVQPPALGQLPARRARYAQAFLRQGFAFRGLLGWPLRPRVPRDRRPREQRRVHEPFRQAFGAQLTRAHGRPVGWVMLCAALDKFALPLLAVALGLAGGPRVLGLALAAELLLWLLVLGAVSPGGRLRSVGRGLLVWPLRYVELAADATGALRFARERWRARRPGTAASV